MNEGMKEFCGVRLGLALFKNKNNQKKKDAKKVLEGLGLNNLSTGNKCILDRLV